MEDFNLHLGDEVMIKLQNGEDPPWLVVKGIISCIVWERGHSFPRVFLRDIIGMPSVYFNPATLSVYLNPGAIFLTDMPVGKITRLIGGC